MQVSTLAFFVVVALAGSVVVNGAPVDEAGDVPPPRTLGRRPFDLGINIPGIYNMKLLTGAGGTGLGINIPAILDLQLDRRNFPHSLLLDFFGASRRNRPRGAVDIKPPRPDDDDNIVEKS